SYIKKHYQTPNIILGISGRYRQEEFDGLVEKFWGKHPKKPFGGWKKVADRQNAPRLKVEFKETQQAHLSIGFKGFAYGDKRNASQSVLSAILGGGMSSRLFIEVREKRG